MVTNAATQGNSLHDERGDGDRRLQLDGYGKGGAVVITVP